MKTNEKTDDTVSVKLHFKLTRGELRGLAWESRNREISIGLLIREKALEGTTSLPWRNQEKKTIKVEAMKCAIQKLVEKNKKIINVDFKEDLKLVG